MTEEFNDSDNILDSIDDYFIDEDVLAESGDFVVYEDQFSSVIKQSDSVVSWSVERLYHTDGSILPSRELKKNPPVLHLSDSDGQSATFFLTKEVSRQLRDVLDDSYKGFFGRKATRSVGTNNLNEWERAKNYIANNVIKVSIGTGLILFILLSTLL